MFKRFLSAVFLLLISAKTFAVNHPKLKTGDIAPIFKTNNFDLGKLKGKVVVLYFYPKNWTTQCSIEAKDFRDHFAEFEKLDAAVVGVSEDSQESHAGFKKEHRLPFVLITDTDGFAKKYGVTGFLWNRRATFLIDRQGKIAFSWYKVDVQDHVKEVLQKLKDLAL